MSRRKLYLSATLIAGVLLVLGLFMGGQMTTSAQSKPTGPVGNSQKPEVSTAVKYDLSPPLTELIAQQAAFPSNPPRREIEEGFPTDRMPKVVGHMPDGALQRDFGLTSPMIPSPVITFSGIPNTCGCSPPDPNGDVSANYYVQMNNSGFQIYDKTGVALTAVAQNNTLWAGFGGPCQTENAGDPVVLHDQMADRWMLTQFTDQTAPFFNCVAISQTSDPRGAYHRYAFSTPSFPDYPHYGIWPDAYYLNTRESGIGVLGDIALERDQMLIGNPAARQVRFTTTETGTGPNGLLPSDLDGSNLPPAGSPNFFVGTQDNDFGAASDAILFFKFHVDWANTANSTFTGPTIIPTAPFDSAFPCTPTSRDCIPQPGTTAKLDILSYRQRPTFRLAYRNYGTHESLVTSQSVEAQPGVAGMRWYELRSPNTTPVIFQQGTYSPDTTTHRWMGSIAMDAVGNMALGFSASNGTDVFPSIRYTGRLAGDPLGTMPQGEGTFINGTGSQTGSPRWGDYTSMNVDPSDDCTFWYTSEYVPTTSAVGWRGGVGAFKFPNCSQGTPTPTVTGTPPTATQTATLTRTSTSTLTPIPTATACNIVTLLDEGFESGTLGVFTGTAIITSTTTPVPTPGWASVASNPHSGTRSAFAPDPDKVTDSRLTTINNINIPAGVTTATLTFWHRFAFENTFDGGVLEVSTDGGTSWTDADANIQQGGYNGTIVVFSSCTTAGTPPPFPAGKRVWTNTSTTYSQVRVNLLPYAGTANMKFRFRLGTDCSVSSTGWNIDDVVVSYGSSGGCATVTGTPPTATGTAVLPTATTTRTNTSVVTPSGTTAPPTITGTSVAGTATATACAAGPPTWSDMAPIPVLRGRAAGATVGNSIYVFGGRPASTTYTDTIYRYDTVANTWTLISTVLPDLNTSNMAAAVLTFPEGQRIFLAGGSGANSFVTARTLAFNPTDNTITTKATWPATPLRIPGGWTVVNNKLYIFGGFEPADIMHTDIWMYDPMTDTWTESATELGTARGYIATELMPDGMVYLAGGMSGDLTDLTTFEKFNPVTQAITAGPDLPQPKSNNHGYNVGGKFYMPTGGIEATNLDTATWVYDPGTNAWSTTTPTLHAVRNYSKGYGADGSIYVIGGADSLGSTFFDFNQKLTFSTGGPCPTATSTTGIPTSTVTGVVPTSTRTSTTAPSATSTAKVIVTATSTACTITFTDVDQTNVFYPFIRCLACRGIISGYGDGTFRPFNDILRGQIAKVVSNSAGFDEDPGPQIYEDVDGSNPFYQWINRLSMRGHMGGYPCGTVAAEPCIGPGNRPYFRPFNNATRGQLAKIVSNAAGISTTPSGVFYTDVQKDNPFYIWIMRLTDLGVMSGYDCGGPGEPCDSENRPYFRPFNNVTRGQASKIVANTFFPGCETPARPLPAEASR
jgi:N-acetylneuraminic acid mutarotase